MSPGHPEHHLPDEPGNLCGFFKDLLRRFAYPVTGWNWALLRLDPVIEAEHDDLNTSQWFKHVLDPGKLVTLVLTDHRGCSQQSDEEAYLMATLPAAIYAAAGFLRTG